MVTGTIMRIELRHKNAINSGMQKRRFALLLHAGYGERWADATRVRASSQGGDSTRWQY